MSGTSLFSRLSSYSQNPHKLSIENFSTELLAHLFNYDSAFRSRFLKVIFSDKRMAKPFARAQAITQEALGHDCRVDLVLRAGHRTHLIEIKIEASETLSARWGQRGKPQIQRYIDLKIGHVTYLTTSASLTPDLDHRGRKFRMVKHAFFEELHEALRNAKVSILTKIFLEFMEENNMAGTRPFNRNEIKRAAAALDLLGKCQSTLAIVRTAVNDQFRKNLKTRSNLTRPMFKGGEDWGYFHSYFPKFSRGEIKWVGLSMEAENDNLYFSVWMWGTLHPTIRKIRSHLKWGKWLDDEHGCCSSIKLYGTKHDVPRMVEHVDLASDKLGRAIRRYA